MNQPIRRLSLVVAAMFIALLVAGTWTQYVKAEEIRALPGNTRTYYEENSVQRGAILVADKAIVTSVPTKNDFIKFRRSYVDPQLWAGVTGYSSPQYGTGWGLEQARNGELSGLGDSLAYNRFVDLLTGRKQAGASLHLTLDPQAQAAAVKALGNRRGAVVALDPTSGALLVMATSPTYDPNKLSEPRSAQEYWKKINADPLKPGLNRAISELYPPGSTFKLVTAAAALSSGSYHRDTVIPGPASIALPQSTKRLPNFSQQPCGPDNESSLEVALENSCNTSFALLAEKLGPEALREQARKFGFGQSLLIPQSVSQSSFPAKLSLPELMMSSIGQFDVRSTPLQMAMVSAGIANGGVLMKPYLVQEIKDVDLSTISTTNPTVFSKPVSRSVAAELRAMMVSTVERGGSQAAKIPGVKVAGKTGTAERNNNQRSTLWWTGFAPADNPRVAIAVVVEDGGGAGAGNQFGETVAAPIARTVMEAVLNK